VPETRAAAERAVLLIEQAEARGEHPEDPSLLLVALSALQQVNISAFNGDLAREGAARLLALGEKQGTKFSLALGHVITGIVLVYTGNFAEAVVHLNQVIALERSLSGFHALYMRSLALWPLGYPEAASASAEQAVSEARETGRAGHLMWALSLTCLVHLIGGNYAIAKARSDELIALADEKGSIYWKTSGLLRRASFLALAGKPSDAVSVFTSAIPVYRSLGMRVFLPVYFSLLARACGELGRFDEAWSYIGEAMTAVETTKETWYEAEVHRIAGEIALMSPEPDAAKTEACFERALAVARAQQAKSWVLRASMSMAGLRRDQGKLNEARDLLAPVYGWFTEGFDTPDLKQAKALLNELAA
jgi:predicted ATPase